MATLRDYGSPAGSVSAKAAARLNALRAARAQDEDASKSGPFYRDPEGMTPEDQEAAEHHHAALADIYERYKRPGLDTTPHTARLSPADRRELADEIDMGRPDYSR